MKITIGVLLSITSLVGALLLGGAAFGEIRSTAVRNATAMQAYQKTLEETSLSIKRHTKVQTDALRKEVDHKVSVIMVMAADIAMIKDYLARSEARNER